MGQILTSKEKVIELCKRIAILKNANLISVQEKNLLCKWIKNHEFEEVRTLIQKKRYTNPLLGDTIEEILKICS